MSTTRTTAVIALIASTLAGANSAYADALRCRRALASESTRFTRSLARALQKCEDAKVNGLLPASTDCATEPTAAAKVGRAEARLARLVSSRCGGGDKVCGTADDETMPSIGWGHLGACPGLPGASCANPISDCDGIATCLTCVGRAAGSQSIALDYGALNQAEFGTGSAVNTCQRTIGRSSAKFYRDRMKALQKCWDARLQNKHGNACPDPGDGKALSRIVRAEARKVARICRACGGSDNACGGGDDLTPAAIGFAAQCHDVTPPTGTSCSGAIADLTGIVTCVDCEDAFETDCVGALGASALVPYPQQCNPTPPPDFCPDPSPALPVGNIKFTATMGTADCGGLQFSTPAAPPFSGQVNDADGVKIVDLGLGCQYAGGSASISPPQRLPDGFSTYVAVTGVNGLQLTLGGSDGTGPADCSKGSGPARHCVNSSPPQPCSSDADCPGISSANACALDANCFVGPPTPVPNPTPELSVCTMNAVVDDVCGTVDLATGAQTQIVSIRSRIFLTGLGAASPCPRCVSGTCTAGERNGLACSGGVGSAGTTVECPPASTGYLGSLGLVLKVSGGASTLVAPNGSFCPAQRSFGAFGLPEARTIIETGSGLAPGGTPGTFSTSIGAVTCIPSSGGALVDAGGDLPGPAAISTVGEIAIPLPLLQQLDDLLCTQLGMCNTLCEILPLLC